MAATPAGLDDSAEPVLTYGCTPRSRYSRVYAAIRDWRYGRPPQGFWQHEIVGELRPFNCLVATDPGPAQEASRPRFKAPLDHRLRRSRTRRTCIGNHCRHSVP